MFRRRVAGAALCAVVLSLTGCVASAPDPAVVQDWMASESARLEALPGVALVMTSTMEAGAAVDDAASVSSAFAEPTAVSRVELECLGEGQMRARVMLTTQDGEGTTTSGAEEGPLFCAGGPHVISVDALAGAGAVVDVEVTGFDADLSSAWSAAVIQDLP
jgi:hypothetical protein